MSEKASSKTIPTKTLGELLDSFREYVQEILEINEPQTNLLIAKARQKRFIDANVLRQKLQEIIEELAKNEKQYEEVKSDYHIDNLMICHLTGRISESRVIRIELEKLLIGLEEAKKP